MQHIAIIDPAARVPELDSYNRLCLLSRATLTYHLPALFGMDSLHLSTGQIKGLVIMGSGASVYDQLPWQEPLNQWLKPKLLSGIPTLGLCYGHQLIAHLFGGTCGLVREDGYKHVGFRQVDIHSERLTGKKSISGPLVVSHKEEVKNCPKDFQVIGNSKEIGIDGIVHKKLPIWGFQPHLEANQGFMINQSIPFDPKTDCFEFGNSLIRDFFTYVK